MSTSGTLGDEDLRRLQRRQRGSIPDDEAIYTPNPKPTEVIFHNDINTTRLDIEVFGEVPENNDTETINYYKYGGQSITSGSPDETRRRVDKGWKINNDDALNMVKRGAQQAEALQLMEFRGCEELQTFFEKLKALELGDSILEPTAKTKASGVSLQAKKEKSVVFIRIPYLGLNPATPAPSRPATSTSTGNGLSLLDYCKNYLGTESNLQREIWVHDLWLVVINTDTILAAKSSSGVSPDTSPILAPYQRLQGPFYACLKIIDSLLQSYEPQLLSDFDCSLLRLQTESHFNDSKTGYIEDLKQLLIILRVLDEQIQVLHKLRAVFGHIKAEDANVNAERDQVIVPVLSYEHHETLTGKIEAVLGRRSEVQKKLEKILELMRRIESLAAQHAAAQQQVEIAAALREQAEASAAATREQAETSAAAVREQAKINQMQLHASEVLNDEVAQQGKTLSMFTAVNVLFLPLGFFSQYFGLDISTGYINSQARFWAYTGSVCVLFLSITLYYVILSQYEGRKIWRFLYVLFRFGRVHRFLTRAEVSEQNRYLKGLPKYRIELVNRSPTETPPTTRHLKHPKVQGELDKLIFSADQETPGVFRFDEVLGMIFLDLIDVDDNLFYLHRTRSSPYSTSKSNGLEWKRIKLPQETRQRLFLHNKFNIDNRGILERSYCDKRILWTHRNDTPDGDGITDIIGRRKGATKNAEIKKSAWFVTSTCASAGPELQTAEVMNDNDNNFYYQLKMELIV